MNKPKEFTNDQWRLTVNQTVSRMFSVMCEGFGAQFFLLWIMQNMTVEIKSLQTLSVSVIGVVGSIMLLLPIIKRNAITLAYPLIVIGTIFGVVCDLIILDHPIAVVFVMSIFGGLVRSLQGGSWSVLLNRCFQGDAKSGNGFWVGAGATIGVSLSAVLVFWFSSISLQTVVYVDIALTIIDCALTCGRIWELKRFLKTHPYEEKIIEEEEKKD